MRSARADLIESRPENPSPGQCSRRRRGVRCVLLVDLDELLERRRIHGIIHQGKRVVSQSLIEASHEYREAQAVEVGFEQQGVVLEIRHIHVVLLEKCDKFFQDDVSAIHFSHDSGRILGHRGQSRRSRHGSNTWASAVMIAWVGCRAVTWRRLPSTRTATFAVRFRSHVKLPGSRRSSERRHGSRCPPRATPPRGLCRRRNGCSQMQQQNGVCPTGSTLRSPEQLDSAAVGCRPLKVSSSVA